MLRLFPLPLLLLLLSQVLVVGEGWISSKRFEMRYHHTSKSQYYHARSTGEHPHGVEIPPDLHSAVQFVAVNLWGGSEALGQVLLPQNDHDNNLRQGEMSLPASIPTSQRYAYFLEQANLGNARAQHSVGLLLWNGFAEHTENIRIDPKASARWHAAAAVQGNVDALAVLGGCLRTGTGVGKNKDIVLGLTCIEYAASTGNPSGINKKAAIMEANEDWAGAAALYKTCYENGTQRNNALLLLNLGYCLVQGDGLKRDVTAGEKLWKDAINMSPDEGSEEAAWFLYEQYAREDEVMAKQWLDIAAGLGHQDAIQTKIGL